MNIIKNIFQMVSGIFNSFLKASIKVKIIIVLIIVAIGWFVYPKIAGSKTTQQQIQTAKVEKGTIITSISASGNVSSANSTVISTQASGVVKKVYVKDGDSVKTGDIIAEIDLDLDGKQRSTQAYASYLGAKNSVENAKIAYYSMHSDLLTNWKSYMDIAQTSLYENSDKTPNTTNRQLPQYMSVQDQWLSVEAKYKQQANVLTQAQTALSSSWSSYQQSSPIVYAPISGVVTGFSLQVGSVLTAQSNTSGTATSQKIANIKTSAYPTILVNLTEIDIPKVRIGNKVTVTFDAFSGKTFTGTVISIDTVGAISSGVTSYPTVIKLDTEVPGVLSNMSAQASIITDLKDNVLLVPLTAVQTLNGQSTVRVMKNGQVQQVDVEAGLSSDSQTEIVSGLNEGDEIVTSSPSLNSTTSSQSRTNNQTQSPFGSLGGGANRGGGGFGGGGR